MIDEDAHAVQWQAEHLGQNSTHHEGGLRREPDCQLAGAIPPANTDVWLHIGRCRTAHFILAFNDAIGLRKPLRNVASSDDDRIAYQVATGPGFVNERRNRGRSEE